MVCCYHRFHILHLPLHRAAFQYGIKMSEGRKTRRFKETNEKAELDRQWKKISAVRIMLIFILNTCAYLCGKGTGLLLHKNILQQNSG